MTKEQEVQQAQTIADHEAFAAKFKEFASEPQNELSKQSEEVLQSKLNQAEKSLIDLQAQEIARLESKKTQVFQVCRANIKWQREQRKLQAQKIAEQEKEIERLSKRGVKKYSEEELRTAFRAMIQRNVIMLTAEQTTMVEAGWLDCARFLGTLEEK